MADSHLSGGPLSHSAGSVGSIPEALCTGRGHEKVIHSEDIDDMDSPSGCVPGYHKGHKQDFSVERQSCNNDYNMIIMLDVRDMSFCTFREVQCLAKCPAFLQM